MLNDELRALCVALMLTGESVTSEDTFGAGTHCSYRGHRGMANRRAYSRRIQYVVC